MGVSRYAWETTLSGVCPGAVARDDRVALVADATLYDTAGLVAELERAGKRLDAMDPAALMLAAYGVWRYDFPLHLNGDFAFVLWDSASRELVFGRDFVGRRSLFVRTIGSGVAVASHAVALDSLAEPPRINRDFVGAAVAGLLGGSRETAFEGVTPVLAGSVLRYRIGGACTEAARWTPPRFRAKGRADLREGAIELRRLLEQAVADRVREKRVVVYLSGGADSPAVLAAGCSAKERGLADTLFDTVSVSFPEGDSAREDDHIKAINDRWELTPHWVDSEGMLLFDDQHSRAALRDDPYAHTFEQMNRCLARVARGAEARVVLDGHGGDLLFQVSQAAFAELLFAGDVAGWWRMLREGEHDGLRDILRWGIAPALPDFVWRVVDVFRQQPLARPFEQHLPGWIRANVRASLEERGWARSDLERHALEGPAAFECRWYMTSPYMPRALAWSHDLALQEGIEVRSPLLDKRVVEFAASRPVAERAPVGDSKRLLKEAVRGLLPDSVLAPRSYKTGVPRGYFHRQMIRGFGEVVESVFGSQGVVPPQTVLADLGILDLEAFRKALAAYRETEDHLTGVQLFLTVEAELWLRKHME